ncbi:MAG: redoxin domain-containing protein [Bacteroidales bacterium]
MKKFIILLFIALLITNTNAQTIKNLKGEEVKFWDIFEQPKDNKPLIIYTWSYSNCGKCSLILDKLNQSLPELKEKYGLRVIAINTDNAEALRIKFPEMFAKYQNSVKNFVNAQIQQKGWNFESYYDDNNALKNELNMVIEPHVIISVNKETVFAMKGIMKNGNNQPDANISLNYVLRILKSIYEDQVCYFDENWKYILEYEKPVYKREIIKTGNMYEITDSWISGEIQMKGYFKDRFVNHNEGKCTWYYKNGNKESEINFKENIESGIEKAFYENGNLKFEGINLKGKREMEWSFYDIKGKLTETVYYEKGIKIKEEKIADPSNACEGNCSKGVGKIESENVTYIGEFKDNKVTGLGTFYLPNNEFYFGTFDNNLPHGLNYHVYSNWEFDVSYFNHGEKSETKINAYKAIDDLDLNKSGCVSGDCKNGYGVYIFNGNWDGDIYFGTWKNGLRDGIGNYYYKNGAIYNGEFKENHLSGKGTYFFETGDVFVGNWKNNLRHGKGLYIFNDLTSKKGLWVEDKFTN